MKLKNLLVLALLGLTLVPIIFVSLLLYKSGYNLSKESYTHSLTESIKVQSDYIDQAIENIMIADYRFVGRNKALFFQVNTSLNLAQSSLLSALQGYLDSAEDKVTLCVLLGKDNVPFYSIGEKSVLDQVVTQLPDLTKLDRQEVMEFSMKDGYSLGLITPIRSASGTYEGSFISVYSKYYIFKIISSYYKIANSATILCRADGTIITFQEFTDEKQKDAITLALAELSLSTQGVIDSSIGATSILGYYQQVKHTPWFLVGFIDEAQIYAFINRYLWVYFFIIVGVCILGILLAFYFSHRVVKPINSLIAVMDEYQSNPTADISYDKEEKGYFEVQYLRSTFSSLMKTVMLVKHNFEGVYQLYQSSNIRDINIDIDIKKQTIASNKAIFQDLMNEIDISQDACIVDKFVNCFCERDQDRLMEILGNMRDNHLSIACEAEVYTPHLGQRWYHAMVVPLYNNEYLARFFVQLRDISDFKMQEQKSTELARKDVLTSLYNRNGFTELVKNILDNPHETGPHGLLFIDMDYFKMVNDNLGHAEGDALLLAVAKTVQEVAQPSGIPARFGGDEFMVFLPRTSPERLKAAKLELCRRLVYPYKTEQIAFTVSASIGTALWRPQCPSTLEDMLWQADASMYQTKKEFKQGLPR